MWRLGCLRQWVFPRLCRSLFGGECFPCLAKLWESTTALKLKWFYSFWHSENWQALHTSSSSISWLLWCWVDQAMTDIQCIMREGRGASNSLWKQRIHLWSWWLFLFQHVECVMCEMLLNLCRCRLGCLGALLFGAFCFPCLAKLQETTTTLKWLWIQTC